MRLLVTRPEPDASTLAKRLARHGHEPICVPLLDVVPVDPGAIDFEGAQALIVTSRNALRVLSALRLLGKAKALPLFAVGPATAELASALGFVHVVQGPGDVAGLAECVIGKLKPADGKVIHLAGADLAGDLRGALETAGFALDQPVLYRMGTARLAQERLSAAFDQHAPEGVLLLSPRTAKLCISLLSKLNLADRIGALHWFCLSPAVAEALTGAGAVNIHVSNRPDLKDLLALCDRLASH